jgi:hypothetical protein
VRANPGPNSTTVNFLITVKDVTPPSFDLSSGSPGAPFVPSNPAEATSTAGAQVQYTNPSASDSNGGPVTVTCASNGGLHSGNTFPIGTTAINCVATDKSGVSTPPTNLFDIGVADRTPPSITLNGPAAITLEIGTTYVDAGASASDLVAGAITVTKIGTVQSNQPGTYTVTYRATDPSGNTATATRTVTVSDTQAPVVTTAATPNILLWSPNKTMTPVTIAGVISDRTLTGATYTVVDEYGKIQPSGVVAVGANGAYAFIIKLEAYRNGNDADGRLYTISVKAADAWGHSTTVVTFVKVPHNQ